MVTIANALKADSHTARQRASKTPYHDARPLTPTHGEVAAKTPKKSTSFDFCGM